MLAIVLLFECTMERVGSLKRDKRTGEKIDGDKSRKRTGSGSSHSSLVGFEAKYPVSYTRKEGGQHEGGVECVVCRPACMGRR